MSSLKQPRWPDEYVPFPLTQAVHFPSLARSLARSLAERNFDRIFIDGDEGLTSGVGREHTTVAHDGAARISAVLLKLCYYPRSRLVSHLPVAVGGRIRRYLRTDSRRIRRILTSSSSSSLSSNSHLFRANAIILSFANIILSPPRYRLPSCIPVCVCIYALTYVRTYVTISI